MRDKKTVQDVDVAGKTVLVRVDFNVPFRPSTTDISDDTRIRASLPTIRYLREQHCRVVLCSHLGRPKGKAQDALRMAPVTQQLSELIQAPVIQALDCVGPEVARRVERLALGDVMMLENTRFHHEEEANNPDFARELSSIAEVYVSDAFGAAHRAHASTEGVAHFLPAVAGLLMARELEVLGSALGSPRRPFAAIIGGAKVSDKMAVLENLASRVDVLIIGGGMTATFLAARGLGVGESPVEVGLTSSAAKLLDGARQQVKVLLPVDVMVADSFSANAGHRLVDAHEIPPGWRIMDVGPRTTSDIGYALTGARTVLWNGPLGVFEWKAFAAGTTNLSESLAGLPDATTVIGGGSTAEAVRQLGLSDQMTHVSTGGGASLEFLEGKTLPGVAALLDKD